jgi:hypothetical protein
MLAEVSLMLRQNTSYTKSSHKPIMILLHKELIKSLLKTGAAKKFSHKGFGLGETGGFHHKY